jgi:hypothetical protein
LWLETAHGAPRSADHRWFVARSPRSEAEGDEVRGVLLVKPRGDGTVVSSPNVSLFVPPRTGPAGEAVVRALLDQVEFMAASGGVHVSGLAQEWLPLVRERAAAAGARESWLLPCLALHCPEARFVPQPDPSAQLLAQSLRLDTISPSSTRAVFVLSFFFLSFAHTGEVRQIRRTRSWWCPSGSTRARSKTTTLPRVWATPRPHAFGKVRP